MNVFENCCRFNEHNKKNKQCETCVKNNVYINVCMQFVHSSNVFVMAIVLNK